MSHDYHEIEDDVLVAVLKALGIDASNDEAINQSITSIKSERETRVVAPTVLHIVGKESKVEVHGGMFDVPEASITLENGKQFTGKISHEGGEKIAHEIDGSFFFTSYLGPPICPKAITPSRSLSAARRRLQPLSALLRKSSCSMI